MEMESGNRNAHFVHMRIPFHVFLIDQDGVEQAESMLQHRENMGSSGLDGPKATPSPSPSLSPKVA